jgi:hypothetical protein
MYVVCGNNLHKHSYHKRLIIFFIQTWPNFMFNFVWMYFIFCVQMGQSLPNEEINTYYKGFSVLENLIELRLFWFKHCVHDWNEVVTMLQICPKLQTLSISKVCWSRRCTFIGSSFLFSSSIFTNPIVSLINSAGIQRLQRIGITQIMFLNVFPLI